MKKVKTRKQIIENDKESETDSNYSYNDIIPQLNLFLEIQEQEQTNLPELTSSTRNKESGTLKVGNNDNIEINDLNINISEIIDQIVHNAVDLSENKNNDLFIEQATSINKLNILDNDDISISSLEVNVDDTLKDDYIDSDDIFNLEYDLTSLFEEIKKEPTLGQTTTFDVGDSTSDYTDAGPKIKGNITKKDNYINEYGNETIFFKLNDAINSKLNNMYYSLLDKALNILMPLKISLYAISEMLPTTFTLLCKGIFLILLVLYIITPEVLLLMSVILSNVLFWCNRISNKMLYKKKIITFKRKLKKYRQRAYSQMKVKFKNSKVQQLNINTDMLYSSFSNFKAIEIPFYCNNTKLIGELDTGAGLSICSKNVLDKIYNHTDWQIDRKSNVELYDVQHNSVPILGSKRLKMYIPTFGILYMNMVILDNNDSTILFGRNFCLNTQLELLFKQPGGYNIQFRKNRNLPHLQLAEDLQIRGNSYAHVEVKAKNIKPFTEYIIKNSKNLPIQVKQTFVNHHSKPKILIENKSPLDLTMKKDDLKFSLVRVVNQPYKLEKSLKKVDEIIDRFNIDMTLTNIKKSNKSNLLFEEIPMNTHSRNFSELMIHPYTLSDPLKSKPFNKNRDDMDLELKIRAQNKINIPNNINDRDAIDTQSYIKNIKHILKNDEELNIPPTNISNLANNDENILSTEEYLHSYSTDNMGVDMGAFYKEKAEPIDIDAPPDLKGRIKDFIEKLNIGARHVFDCGKLSSKIDPIDIKLKSECPKNTKMYRTTYEDKLQLSAFFQYLVFHGLARPAPPSRQFGSPCFLLARPGSNRMPRLLVDLRSVNSCIADNLSISMPEAYFSLKQISNCAKYATVIDIKQAFYSIPISEATIATGIQNVLTPVGVFEITRSLTGLNQSPSCLNAILAKYLHQNLEGEVDFITNILQFYDDIAIFTNDDESLEDHIQKVFKVLSRLSALGMKINLQKSQFCVDLEKTSVKILGYELKKGSLTIPKKKVEAIINMRVPRKLKDLLSYIGSITYFRYLSNLCIHAFLGVLHRTTQLKDKAFVWTKEAQTAFESIRQELIDNVQRCESLNDPTVQILLADASSYGLGACLINTDLSPFLPKPKVNSTSLSNSAACELFQDTNIKEIASDTNIFLALYKATKLLGFKYFENNFAEFIHVIALHGAPFINYSDYLNYNDNERKGDNKVEAYSNFINGITEDYLTLHDHYTMNFLLKSLASLLRRKLVILRPYKGKLVQMHFGLDNAKPIYILDDTTNFVILQIEQQVNCQNIDFEVTIPHFSVDNYTKKDIVSCFFDQLKNNPTFNKHSKICGFFSKSIPSDLLARTSSSHLELNAIFQSLIYFESELLSKNVFCLSDNSSAISLLKSTKTSPRNNKLDLLSLKVSLYFSKRVSFLSCAGKENLSDVLSRLLPEEDIKRAQFPKGLSVRFDQPEIIDVPVMTKKCIAAKMQNHCKPSMLEKNILTLNNHRLKLVEKSEYNFQKILKHVEYVLRELYESDSLNNILNAVYTQNWLLLGRSLVQLVLKEIIPRIKGIFIKENESNNSEVFSNNPKVFCNVKKITQDIDNTSLKASFEEASFTARKFKDVFSKSLFIALQREEIKVDHLDPTEIYYIKNKIYLPKKLYVVYALAYHGQLHHPGMEKLYKVLTTYFYIDQKKVLKDIVRNITINCKTCMVNKENTNKNKQGSIHENYLTHVNQLISMDLLELSTTQAKVTSDAKAILVICDNYSKYVTFFPIEQKTTEQIKAKLNIYFSIFGICQFVHTDNAKIFRSKKFFKYLKKLEITLIRSSPMRSACRGFIEHRVKLCQRLLRFHFHSLPDNHVLDIGTTLAMFSHSLNTIPFKYSCLNSFNIQFMSLKNLSGDITKSQEYIFQKEFFWDEKSLDEKFKSKEYEVLKLIKETVNKIKKDNLARLAKENRNRIKSKIKVGDFCVIRDFTKDYNQKNKPLFSLDVYQVVERKKYMLKLKQPFLSKSFVIRHISQCKKLDVEELEKFKIPPSLQQRIEQYTKNDIPKIDYPLGEYRLKKPLSPKDDQNADNNSSDNISEIEDTERLEDFNIYFNPKTLLPTIAEEKESQIDDD